MTPALDSALDELFAVAPHDFVAARTRIAAALTQKKRTKEAALIRQVRRVTASVWVVNHLYRREQKAFARLLRLGAEMRASQKGGGATMAALQREQADSLNRLHEAAVQALGTDSTTTMKRVDTTLRALSAIGSFAPDAPGRLTSDREGVGFDAAFSAPIVVKPAATRAAKPSLEQAKTEAAAVKSARAARARVERAHQRELAQQARVLAKQRERLEKLEKERAHVAIQLANIDTQIAALRSSL